MNAPTILTLNARQRLLAVNALWNDVYWHTDPYTRVRTALVDNPHLRQSAGNQLAGPFDTLRPSDHLEHLHDPESDPEELAALETQVSESGHLRAYAAAVTEFLTLRHGPLRHEDALGYHLTAPADLRVRALILTGLQVIPRSEQPALTLQS